MDSPDLNMSPIVPQFENMTVDELNYSVSRFICEVKKSDGTDYPPDTLYALVISLQLYCEKLGYPYKFISHTEFSQIRHSLDNIMQERAKAGTVSGRRQAQVITIEEEDALWMQGVLGKDTPTKMFHTLVYLIGINFALRGGDEHRNLRVGPTSQLSLETSADGIRFLRYTEDVSKANKGGLKHRRVQKKRVDAFQNKTHPERCLISLYEEYLHLRPQNAPDALYLRPLIKPGTDSPWFSLQVVGRQTLSRVVPDICKEGGLPGYRTNHSLRATSATRLYDADVDEQAICEITGHRSNSVRSYKRTNESRKRKISQIIQGENVSKDEADTSATDIKTPKSDRNVTITLNINCS